MRIAIPIVNNELSAHFGHCEKFELVDVDKEKGIVLARKSVPAPEHQPGLLPQWLGEYETELLIAGGIGNRARELLVANGISVLAGVDGGEPMDLVDRFLQDSLVEGENVCDH